VPCPHCPSTSTTQRSKKTPLGYRTFCCHACKHTFNERTGTPYNYLEFPTDVVLLVVRWRLRDLAEMFGERGFAFTHEAVREWEARFAPLVADKLRAKRTDQVGRSWHVDEMDIRVGGTWKYLYRAIERDGNLVDSMLSEHRDMDAAKRFFRAALEVAEQTPEKVTTDGHDSYPRVIREILGADVTHRCNPYLNNRIEQDHRGIKQRYYPMRGFGNVDAAARFCRAFDEQQQYFRMRTTMRQRVLPLAEQRRAYCARWTALMDELMAA
jgi:transposase-like protein